MTSALVEPSLSNKIRDYSRSLPNGTILIGATFLVNMAYNAALTLAGSAIG